MYKPVLFALLSFFFSVTITAQQLPQPVTESSPVTINGLSMGYRIKSEEEKEVKNKGSFSRYAVKFIVTNTGNESKIILYKEGWNVLGNVSDQLAQFDCLNATGARFTSKGATIRGDACNVLAITDEKDANGKPVKGKKFVQIGYWIKAGQTISADAIVIVPLNEKPNVQVTYLAGTLQPAANAIQEGSQPYPNNNGYSNTNNNGYPNNGNSGYNNNNGNSGNSGYNNNNGNLPLINNAGFAKIKNTAGNRYLNNQQGPLGCGPIDNGWWSAQWQIIPIPGTNYYSIKNRWKEFYISSESPADMVSANPNSSAAMWIAEPVKNNIFRFRNVGNNGYLNIATGNVQSSFVTADTPGSNWELIY